MTFVDENSKIVTEFYDDASDDLCEDSFSVCSKVLPIIITSRIITALYY
jgi:hypothetical protein